MEHFTKKTQTIRVSPSIHHLAKLASLNEQTTLQKWIEELIQKECKNKKNI